MLYILFYYLRLKRASTWNIFQMLKQRAGPHLHCTWPLVRVWLPVVSGVLFQLANARLKKFCAMWQFCHFLLIFVLERLFSRISTHAGCFCSATILSTSICHRKSPPLRDKNSLHISERTIYSWVPTNT